MRSTLAAVVALSLVLLGNAEARRLPAAPSEEIYAVRDTGPSIGPDDAKVTLVVGIELAEPFTRRLWPVLEELRDTYREDLRIVFRHYVVHPKIGRPAALAFCAAARQGKAMEMADAIWREIYDSGTRDYSETNLARVARRIGVRPRRYRRDLNRCNSIVDADKQELTRLGVRGVPHTFVNGRPLRGAQPRDRFVRVIDEELGKATRRLKGKPARGYYRRWVLARGLKKMPAEKTRTRQPRRLRPEPDEVYAVPADPGAQLGRDDALVTWVVAVELAEPFSRRLWPIILELKARYGDDLRVVFQSFVVHPTTGTPAAKAACAADRQGRYLDMAEQIWTRAYEAGRDYSESNLEKLAAELGLDLRRFRKDRVRCEKEITQQQSTFARFGVQGVPASFINGRFLSGARPSAQFSKLIDEELSKARKRARRPRSKRYYRRWVLKRGKKRLGE